MVARIIFLAGTVLLALLADGVTGQDCASEFSNYALDFMPGTEERWMYENVAPGAECITISRTLNDEERCNEFTASKPDSEWPSYEKRRLLDDSAVVLNIDNYGQYMDGGKFPREVCIHACRLHSWCKSVTWNYDYDACRLNYLYGFDLTVNTSGVKWYIEKPQCPEGGAPKNGSNSWYRLALKKFASQQYGMAKMDADRALMAGKWWKMNYWLYSIMTLVEGDFSSASITEANDKMNLDGFEYPDIAEYENATLQVLLDALKLNDVSLSLASGSEQLYVNSGKTDLFAAVIAAVSYRKSGRMSNFKSLLEEVLQTNPSNIAALYLYLNQYAMDRDTLQSQDNNTIVSYVQSLVAADPTNPHALSLAVYVYYHLNMPSEVLGLTDRTLDSLPAAVSNNLISNSDAVMIRIRVYTYSHFSNIYRNDLNGAQQIELIVKAQSTNMDYDIDTRAMFKALLYRQEAKRYFQFAFTESAQRLMLIPMRSVDAIDVIDASDGFHTIGRLSQYMNRQHVITQQIRNGTYTNYQSMVDKWETLRDGASFDSQYTSVVNYNLLLLMTEYALMQGNSPNVLSRSGYLDEAYLLIDSVDSMYIVMEIQEMVAYAVDKIALDTAAPLGQTNDYADKTPNNLLALIDEIKQTWPPNTPSKLNIIASLQLALGDIEDSRETLEEAMKRLIPVNIQWLNTAMDRVDNYDVIVSAREFEPITGVIPQLTFNDEDKTVFDGLDIDWDWTPGVSPLEPCTSYRYRDGNVDSSVWPMRPKSSVRSALSAGYFSTNSYSCKLRCLFEKEFNCKAFTFGFNRCLLHSQSYDEVAADDQLSVEDEVYYDVPVCPEQVTNAYSQLLLGGKAMSNSLTSMAIEKFEEANALDPLMSLPQILKALLVYGRGCPSSRMEATDLLSDVMPRTKTAYEISMFNAVNNTIHDRMEDAISDYEDIDNDKLVSYILSRLMGQPRSNPEIAADYIYSISQDVLAAGASEHIDTLQQISPKSVMPRIFRSFTSHLRGNWQSVISTVNSIANDVANGDYVGVDADSPDKHFRTQLEHFAKFQIGKYDEANSLYMANKGEEKLGAYMYATQLYTTMIDVDNMRVVEQPGVIDDRDMCSDMAAIVALSMRSSSLYVDPNLDSSQKDSEENKLTQEFNDINNPMVDGFKSTWRDVSDVFYRLGKAESVTTAQGISSRVNLSPSIVPDLGVLIIHPDELKSWAILEKSDPSTSDFMSVEATLNGVSTASPGRIVTKWLKYNLYRKWRSYDDSHRNETLVTGKDLLDQWSEGDQDAVYDAVYDYLSYPDPSQDGEINYKTIGEGELPDWAIYAIIGCSAAVLLAFIVSCIVCAVFKHKQGKGKKNLYSGSIYSASTTGHSEQGMVPEHGEVLYGGHRNDAMAESTEQDFVI